MYKLDWTFSTGIDIQHAQFDGGGRLVVAGARQLYCFEANGALAWMAEVPFDVQWLRVAEISGTVVAASSRAMNCLNADGVPLWSRSWGGTMVDLDLSADGRRTMIAINSEIHLIDVGGTDECTHRVSGLTGAAMTTDGTVLLYTAHSRFHGCLNTEGETRWRWPRSSISRQGVSREDGGSVVLGDSGVQLIDAHGRQVARFDMHATAASLSGSGRYLAVLDHVDRLHVFDGRGHPLWQADLDSIFGDDISVVVSDDGRWALVRGGGVTEIVAAHGKRLLAGLGRSGTVATTPAGGAVAVAANDGRVRVFRDRSIEDTYPDVDDRTRRLARLRCDGLKRQVVDNWSLGIADWLGAIDDALTRDSPIRAAELVERLEPLVQDRGADLANMVASRRAAVLLCQGAALQRADDVDQAVDCFRQSVEIHRQAECSAGEGQARMALGLIVASESPPEEVTRLLRNITYPPNVVGKNTTALRTIYQEQAANPAQRLRCVEAAAALRLPIPLTDAIDDPVFSIRATAIEALINLWPGPGRDVWDRLLADDSAHVRWRAVSRLGEEACDEDQIEWCSSRITQLIARPETDPLVLTEALRLVPSLDLPDAMELLTGMLGDEDAEVRAAAIDGLGKVGDRSVLGALHSVEDGQTSRHGSISACAEAAIQSISARYPRFSLSSVVVTPNVDGSNAGHGIVIGDPIHCIVEGELPADAMLPMLRWGDQQLSLAPEPGQDGRWRAILDTAGLVQGRHPLIMVLGGEVLHSVDVTLFPRAVKPKRPATWKRRVANGLGRLVQSMSAFVATALVEAVASGMTEKPIFLQVRDYLGLTPEDVTVLALFATITGVASFPIRMLMFVVLGAILAANAASIMISLIVGWAVPSYLAIEAYVPLCIILPALAIAMRTSLYRRQGTFPVRQLLIESLIIGALVPVFFVLLFVGCGSAGYFLSSWLDGLVNEGHGAWHESGARVGGAVGVLLYCGIAFVTWVDEVMKNAGALAAATDKRSR